MDVLPTPVSPSNSTLYVTSRSLLTSDPPPVDDETRDDDVVDDDADDIRAIVSRSTCSYLTTILRGAGLTDNKKLTC